MLASVLALLEVFILVFAHPCRVQAKLLRQAIITIHFKHRRLQMSTSQVIELNVGGKFLPFALPARDQSYDTS